MGSLKWLVVVFLSLSACGAAETSKLETEQAALRQRVQTLEARIKKLESKGGKAPSKAPAKAKAPADGAAKAKAPADAAAKAKAKTTKTKSPATTPAPAPK